MKKGFKIIIYLMVLFLILFIVYFIVPIFPYTIKENKLDKVVYGVTTKLDVQEILGNPLNDPLMGNPSFQGDICDKFEISDIQNGSSNYEGGISSESGINNCISNFNGMGSVSSCIYEANCPPLIFLKFPLCYQRVVYFTDDKVCYIEKRVTK
ncbi:hypothetical protein CMI38_03210 [Candidatus Pacearchaeota archaeon]|nr:hypothetical protein [Candidatus Pacearchaeota archaeon]|tara:strand:- start:694 stop:1152 length:459 start_codon:yes stop_codon:yes gene_type:complete